MRPSVRVKGPHQDAIPARIPPYRIAWMWRWTTFGSLASYEPSVGWKDVHDALAFWLHASGYQP